MASVNEEVAALLREHADLLGLTKHLDLPRGQRWAYQSDGHQLPP